MKGIVVGVVGAQGLGDLVQYVTAALIIKRHIPQSRIYLSIPQDILAKVLLKGTLCNDIEIVRGILSSRLKREASSPSNRGHLRGIFAHGNLTHFFDLITRSRPYVELIKPVITRLQCWKSYDFGVIGGHSVDENTIYKGEFFSAPTFCNASRHIVKGPLITFPISITPKILSLSNKYVKMFRNSLNKLDVIFVRGSITLNTLERLVKDTPVFIAPDSTLALRDLFPISEHGIRRRSIKVIIVPRREYFISLRLPSLYGIYIRELIRSIHLILNRFDLEVIFMPHHIDYSASEDLIAIKDIMKIFGRISPRVKIIVPRSLIDDVLIISSADIVITGRLHAGLIAMAYGKPVIFTLSRYDVRINDVFSTLKLDLKNYVVDICSKRELNNMSHKVLGVIDSLDQCAYEIQNSINQIIDDVHIPAKVLAKLIKG